MTDEPIDFKNYKVRKVIGAHDKLSEMLWHDLQEVAAKYAEAAAQVPQVHGDLKLRTDPEAVYTQIIEESVSLMQANESPNEEIIKILLSLIVTVAPPPEGTRLAELIDRANDLVSEGDEEFSIKFDKIGKATEGMTAEERSQWYKDHKDDPAFTT